MTRREVAQCAASVAVVLVIIAIVAHCAPGLVMATRP